VIGFDVKSSRTPQVSKRAEIRYGVSGQECLGYFRMSPRRTCG
jgi:hypothetical protein